MATIGRWWDRGDLRDRVAIVTGGGSGIGRACAHEFGVRGAKVVVSDIEMDRADEVAASIRSAGGEAVAVLGDVSDEDSVQGLVKSSVDLFGTVNILHNNAAITDPAHQIRDRGPIEVSLELWNRTVAVDLTGQFLMCKHVLPVMLAAGGGSIVNMSSLDGVLGDANAVAYSVCKAGVLALTRSVATRYGRHGVRCNAIAPGIVMTESVARNLSEPVQSVWLDNLLVPEAGGPHDVASVVAFLASDAAAYINGQVINVDGGVSAHLPIYEGMRRLTDRRMPTKNVE